MSRSIRRLLILGMALLAAAATVLWLNLRGEAPLRPDAGAPPSAQAIQRGAYLARAGNCEACHTARGGAAYAGGRAIATPFGTVYAGNLTPEPRTGLGRWTADEFWRALHHGRSRDGRLLYPAFPYPSFTLVSRDDADALWAYLRSLAPVVQARPAHALRWPYSNPVALALWRALYFRAAGFEPMAGRDAAWNRGAYLVNGLGHCGACHAQRNLLGASAGLGEGPGGSALPQQAWLAPSLTDAGGSALASRSADELVRLLKNGLSERAAVMGPMAEVVAGSTQHLSPADLRAMVVYLQSLATSAVPPPPPRQPAAPAATLARGEKLYRDHCVACHGDQGQGAPGIYPALAHNPTVTMADARNLLQAIRAGGFPPATAANPRPYGMPPFDLPHADLAALATWLRSAWGHAAAPVSEVDALLAR